jgi:hypothetical protein
MRTSCPCKGCQTRYAACQDTCTNPEYMEYQRTHKAVKEARKADAIGRCIEIASTRRRQRRVQK